MKIKFCYDTIKMKELKKSEPKEKWIRLTNEKERKM